MRNKLIELIHECEVEALKSNLHLSPERIADKLLSKGVIVPPCKVGDEIYFVARGRIKKVTAAEMWHKGNDQFSYLLSFDCDDDCPNCPFDSWHQEYSGEYSCDGQWGCMDANDTDFGKTVFLTREEAEQALKAIAERGCKDA